jgi:hypothetical protein
MRVLDTFVKGLIRALLVFALFAPVVVWSQQYGFEELERSLRLTPYQKQQFDVAATATQRAMVAIGLGAIQAKSRVAQELLKDKPDPDAFFIAQDELVEFAKPHLRAARDEWLRLYAMMDDDQVRTARAFIEERLRRLEDIGGILGRVLGERRKP